MGYAALVLANLLRNPLRSVLTAIAVALAVYWLLSGRSRELPWRRMLAVAGVIALGVGLNGWFLLPDLSYAHDTNISGHVVPWSATSAFKSASTAAPTPLLASQTAFRRGRSFDSLRTLRTSLSVISRWSTVAR